ncbi:ankyrin repeat domain-containing protein [Zooshikella ganghwensis]|uniref:Uncharacterized protein n=1 Tax=Zooshikella ganghwensis TaxID=202772 RepID=A0A4P9VFB7_9GAMM|nr:ankyrin repeat domain-containing protein [Zooshikella ganghwensis]RDH41788.1 hypothetical protein B9G39_26535 [Zooshikella ganghwensis]
MLKKIKLGALVILISTLSIGCVAQKQDSFVPFTTDKETLKLYLDGGADINAADEQGLTALHIAARAIAYKNTTKSV